MKRRPGNAGVQPGQGIAGWRLIRTDERRGWPRGRSRHFSAHRVDRFPMPRKTHATSDCAAAQIFRIASCSSNSPGHRSSRRVQRFWMVFVSRFLALELDSLFICPAAVIFQGCIWRHPPCRASIRTLNGPLWARCTLGSDLRPRPITVVVMDLGCWVLPSNRRSLKERPLMRSHPNKAVDVASINL